MSDHVLNISFTDEALDMFKKMTPELALIKSGPDDHLSPVVWVSTAPYQKNKIEWTTDFQAYSIGQVAQSGAKIGKLSEKAPIGEVMYGFDLTQPRQRWPRAREPEIPISAAIPAGHQEGRRFLVGSTAEREAVRNN